MCWVRIKGTVVVKDEGKQEKDGREGESDEGADQVSASPL